MTQLQHQRGKIRTESGTDDSPYGGYGDGLDTSVSVAEPSAQEGAEESAGKIIDCDLESHTSDE